MSELFDMWIVIRKKNVSEQLNHNMSKMSFKLITDLRISCTFFIVNIISL